MTITLVTLPVVEPFGDAGPDYLEQLLAAAVRPPVATDDPAGGRIAAALLVALAARNADERVEPYLAWGPDRPTVYEVRCYDQSERLVSSDRHDSAGAAIRATGVVAADPANTARVVAIAEDGEERWMMAVRASAAVLRLPDPGEIPATPPVATELVEALRHLLAGMTVQVDATAIDGIVRRALGDLAPAPAIANGNGAVTDPGTLDPLVQRVVTQLATMIPTADDIADTVTRRLAARPVPPAAVPRPRPTLPPPRPEPVMPTPQG